ncbi:MAG: tRNA pseudouridine(38-40) synthase TruA [Defluviitaleaceae bacterium]|nr:tRNA pseudouridine(38-40) synthase TruA [Defluviitaleaceae bacterium]
MGILLKVAYDGTNYAGWQIQKNDITVHGVLHDAIKQILNGSDFSLLGASRTDAGVHALGQCVHLMPENLNIPVERLPYALNSVLPKDIAVLDSKIVSDDFHPIRDAISKTYIYKIWNKAYRNPLLHNYSAHISKGLDVELMQESCIHFVGKHDFAAFCATGSSVKTTVREIFSLKISNSNGLIEIFVNGNGFLYNMVRIIAGTLVEVGLGKINPNTIPAIIASCDRNKAGRTMPPQGLTLIEVEYNKPENGRQMPPIRSFDFL